MKEKFKTSDAFCSRIVFVSENPNHRHIVADCGNEKYAKLLVELLNKDIFRVIFNERHEIIGFTHNP